MLSDADVLLDALLNHPQVRLIASGHAHAASVQQRRHIVIATTAALSYGFSPDDGGPGYSIIELSSSGGIRIQDKRIGRRPREQVLQFE